MVIHCVLLQADIVCCFLRPMFNSCIMVKSCSGILWMLLLALVGCTSIDCPLDNVVMMQCNFYLSETETPYKLDHELTVRPAGCDTVLLNRITDVESILLPLKEGADQDTLLLHFVSKTGQEATDTLFVNHTRQLHFESLDCPNSVFHQIHAARVTSHALSELPLTADSVSIVRSTVDYNDIENIRIFLRSTVSE